jgi:hypothetical protein
LPSITATQELVVPRSIPMTFPIYKTSLRQTLVEALSGTSAPDFRGAGPQFKFGRAALISRETRRSWAI